MGKKVSQNIFGAFNILGIDAVVVNAEKLGKDPDQVLARQKFNGESVAPPNGGFVVTPDRSNGVGQSVATRLTFCLFGKSAGKLDDAGDLEQEHEEFHAVDMERAIL